jgi:hypothetical protein
LPHGCQQHAGAVLGVVRPIAGAGVPSSGPGPAGADLALALAALPDELVDQGPVELAVIILHVGQYDELSLLPTLLPSHWTTPAPCGELWNVGPAHRRRRTALDETPTPTDQKVGGSSPSERAQLRSPLPDR